MEEWGVLLGMDEWVCGGRVLGRGVGVEGVDG